MLLMFTTLPKAAKKTEAHDILLLGIPTRYYGEAQCDWDDFFPTLEEIDFNGKLVALFGCGDQKITQNTSATRWAPSATSLSRAARPSSVTGQRRGIILRLPKARRMTTTSSASPLMKTASRS